MKKLLIAPLVLLGACAACCALPLLSPLLAGLLTSGIGVILGGWEIGLAVGATIVVLAVAQVVWRNGRKSPSADPCKNACTSPQPAAPCGCHTGP